MTSAAPVHGGGDGAVGEAEEASPGVRCGRHPPVHHGVVGDVGQTRAGAACSAEKVLLPLSLKREPLPSLPGPVGEAGSVDDGALQQPQIQRASPATLNSSSV